MGAKAKKGNGAFSATRRDLYHARHLPGDMYFSQEIYAREVERIWMKEWLCVGRVEQFPNAGDYKAMRIAGEPVVVCKNAKGQLNAFANVCKHVVSRSPSWARATPRSSRVLITAGFTTSTASSSAPPTPRK